MYSLTQQRENGILYYECMLVIMSEIIDEGVMNDMSEKELVAFLLFHQRLRI